MSRRTLLLVGVLLLLVTAAAGAALAKAGLDDADKWASIAGMFIAFAGLLLSALMALRAGRTTTGEPHDAEGGITASGTRSVAARIISGNVSTGDVREGPHE